MRSDVMIRLRRVARWGAVLTLGVSTVIAAPAAAQWDRQSPQPTHLDVRGIGAPTAQRVFIATEDNSFDDGGALFESADGGATWVQRDVPFGGFDPLNGIFFLDSQSGWAYGNANYRTTDGGTTWTELPPLGSTYFMKFFTPAFGVAIPNSDPLISRDGGLSWQASPSGMFTFDFATSQIGLGISGTGIYRTTDGGATFTLVHAGVADAVAFLSSAVAVAIVNGVLQRSTDAGATWTAGSSAQGRNRLTAVSGTAVIAWGRSGAFPTFDDRVLHSSDAGQTWSDRGEVMADEPIAFTVPGAPIVVGADRAGNMYRSTDSGLAWARTFDSPGPALGFLSSALPVFADAQTGYFGYGAGFVIKTSDGGATWAQISSGTGRALSDIARFSTGDLIAVGETGTLMTRSGSAPWILHPAISSGDLQAVHVVGAQEVVTVDAAGRVYRSGDGGATWTSGSAMPPGLTAADLHFTTLLDGWVTGSGFFPGALFHTTDGGESWTPVPELQGVYVAVDFEGASGWAANVSGIFHRSTDHGATWTQGQLPGSPFTVTDMEFFDESTGWVVGGYGYAARSSDGGASWQVLPTPDSNHMFTDIHVVGANQLWVSTRNGVAYYSATGGSSWSVLDIGSYGFGSYSSITAVAGGDAWTAGDQGDLEHFTGPPPGPVNQPPTAAFDFDPLGLTVTFHDTSSDPDGSIVSWSWDFGDGTGSTEPNPTHTFDGAGTYLIGLTVTDDDGATTMAGRFIVVQAGPGGTFGDFTEVTPTDSLFVTPQDEDFWVATTAPADYDGDGDLDVAVLGFYVVYHQSVEHRLVLLRNDGAASATPWDFEHIQVPLGALSAGASDLAWGDADGDGDQDLVVGSDFQTVIYRNDAGTLVPTNTGLPGYAEDNDQGDFDLRSITWADYDNDGDLDLLLPSVFDPDQFEFRTALMRNDGTDGSGGWVFTEVAAGLAPTRHAQSTWADFDGDQDLDLLLVNLAPLTDESFIRRYRNDGGGTFVGEDILGTLGVEHGEAQWGDCDGDGDLDVLVAGNLRETDGTYTPAALRVYRDDGATYQPIDVLECGSFSCEGWIDLTAATWADYDSDGDVDILLTGSYNSGEQLDGRAKIYVNQAGVFVDSGNQLPAPRANGTRGGTFSWLDLDGDGDLDYFIAGEYFVPGGNGLVEAQMHAYRNDAAGDNQAPTPPTNLEAWLGPGSGEVVLTWAPAHDDLTAQEALTYDLELYRSGVPITTPRRLPQPGSVSASSEWRWAGLADGSYTWTLRAVDSAFNGSAVAQGSFVVGAPVGVEPSAPMPPDFALLRNTPNPFRTTTTLRFALPQASHARLVVYDLAGRVVARLLDGPREAGFHEVRWEPNGLASGVYLVRFSAGGFMKTRRVVLVN